MTERLVEAIENEDENLVRQLLAERVDPSAKSIYGETMLQIASWNNTRPEIVSMLLRHGANVSDLSAFGTNAAHFASHAGNLEIMKVLLKNGIDINVQDKNGDTPLHLAARAKNEDMVRLLLGYGADPNLLNKYNQNVLSVAKGRELKNLLIEYTEREDLKEPEYN